MMLSPQRFWSGLAIGALLVALLFIEPAQQIAWRSAARLTFGDNLSAKRVQLHRRQQVLEVEGLQVSRADENWQVDLSAERGLIKLDLPLLLDKRLDCPKVKLQGVRIELVSLPCSVPSTPGPTTIPAGDTWQAKLTKLLTTLQWEHVREGFESLVTADEILEDLDAKMRGWLLRSQQIMFHADQLTQAIESFSNPLRHVHEIREQLQQLEQLRVEQDGLKNQFSSVNSLLTKHLEEIDSASDLDRSSLRTKAERGSVTLSAIVADQTVHAWCRQLLSRQMMLGQSISVLLQGEPRSSPFNVDIRDVAQNHSPLAMRGIEAEGVYLDAFCEVPFVANGDLSFKPQSDYRLTPQTAWQIQFSIDQVATQLDVVSLPVASNWSLKSSSKPVTVTTASPSDLPSVNLAITANPATYDPATDDPATDDPAIDELATDDRDIGDSALGEMFTSDASLCNGQLVGTAKLNLRQLPAFEKLPCSCNADLTNLLSPALKTSIEDSASQPQWLEFTLHGSPRHPQVTLISPLPASFTKAIADRIQQRLQSARVVSEEKLASHVTSKVDALKDRVESVAQHGQLTVAKQQEILVDMRSRLEQNLKSRDGYEYARLPTSPTATR